MSDTIATSTLDLPRFDDLQITGDLEQTMRTFPMTELRRGHSHRYGAIASVGRHVIPHSLGRDRTSLMKVVGIASAVPAAVATAVTTALTVRAWMDTPPGYTSDEWWFTFPVDDD